MQLRIVGILFVSIVLFITVSIAILLWNDQKILQSVKSGEHEFLKSNDLSSIPSLSIQPLGHVLENLTNFVSQKSDLTLAKAYLKRRPLDPKGWIWASSFAQRQGNKEESLEYLRVAHGLSKRNSFILNEILNRYLELGEIGAATKVAHDLSLANPVGFRRWFSVMSRVTPQKGYKQLVENMIPLQLSDHSKLNPNYYFSTALRVARLQKNEELMEVLWSQMPKGFKKDLDEGFAYLNYSAKHLDSHTVLSIWRDLTGEDVQIGEIANPDFENEISQVSPCFNSKEIIGAKWGRDDTSDSGNHSLKVSFDGEKNLYFSHAKCLIAVEPGRRYVINGMWKGEGVSTLSGVFLDVIFPAEKGFYTRTEAKIGRWPWQEFAIEFNVPLDIELITIRVRRNRTELLDSKISGDVWIDSLDLQHVDVAREIVQ